MEQLSKLMLGVHVFCGFSSLVLFWVPIFTKKGGKAHRLVGKAYVYLMWVVVITAFLLSIENLVQGYYAVAAFLGFLSLISCNPLWYGIAILKHKKALTPGYRNIHLTFNILIFVSGLALLAYGLYLGGKNLGILMIIFGILGLGAGGDILREYRNPQFTANWYKEHYKGMITTAIAAYTAFAAFGGREFFADLLTGYWMILPWVLPTVIGISIIRYMERQGAMPSN